MDAVYLCTFLLTTQQTFQLKGSVAQYVEFGANATAKHNNFSVLPTRFLFCMISGICREVGEIYALLGYALHCGVYSVNIVPVLAFFMLFAG